MEYVLDSIFSVATNDKLNEDLIINLEHQSTYVNEKKIKSMALYSINASYLFAKPVLSIVLTDIDSYNKSIKEYEISESLILRPIYLYFSHDEIKTKLINIINKSNVGLTLSNLESLDFVFLALISPRKYAKEVIRCLVKLFSHVGFVTKRFGLVVSHILRLMIAAFFKGEECMELIEMMNMDLEEATDILLEELEYKSKYQEELKEKNRALSEASLANEEKNRALSEAKVFKDENNRFVEILKYFIEKGKLTAEDLNSFGVFL